ncbi:hypothetical protein CBR_g30058 [Chara braunii]|uniref:DUF659 domain-containing protein n=1 Tax=Chara braunii TaxID=69332 RepID=A0A388LBX6_CHABU|nr:hypothetical protein CBR_g30058 [Chara braunii]|eukprot:GBG79796.1 hypothetical protein CBR_g30058 [Chara braunii]
MYLFDRDKRVRPECPDPFSEYRSLLPQAAGPRIDNMNAGGEKKPAARSLSPKPSVGITAGFGRGGGGPIVVTFAVACRPGETIEKSIDIGNAGAHISEKGKMGGQGQSQGQGGEFSIEGLGPGSEATLKGFSVDLPRSSVEAGGRRKVTFKFTAPSPKSGQSSQFRTLAELGLEEWIEAPVTCIFKGGTPPPEPEREKMVLLLKAYVTGRKSFKKVVVRMASTKYTSAMVKRHCNVDGVAGKDPSKGDKWWVCKYCDLKFSGSLNRVKEHYSKRICAAQQSKKVFTDEEKEARKQGLRQALADVAMANGDNSLLSGSSLATAPTAVENVGRGMGKGGGASDTQRSASSVWQMVLEETDNIITKNEMTSRKVDNWLTCTNQPFNMVENEFYLDMGNAIRNAHPSWQMHSREAARNGRLDGQNKRCIEDVRMIAKKWERTRCMVQMDGWSDRRGRPHINIMVSSPVGNVFWRSVCVEGKEKDSIAYYNILDAAIQDIGPKCVVGVIMNNARVCVKVGKLVEKKYPWIFRVGCTAHALDLALEDFDKCIGWFSRTVKRANELGKFIMNHDKVRAFFLERSGLAQIKRPGVTRFATNILMLQSLWDGKNALKLAPGAKGWVSSMVRTDLRSNFEEATTTILDESFWDDVEKSIKATEAIVKLLRMVDGPGATISKVYHHMDVVVEGIRTLEVLTDFEKAEVESILMDRWAFRTSELYCAAAFLDPEFRAQSAIHDTEIRAGFNIWLRRTKMLLGRLAKLVYNNWNLHLQWRQEKGAGEDDVHIPWMEDLPDAENKAEAERYYNEWVQKVKVSTEDMAAGAKDDSAVIAELDDEGDLPLARRWVRNDRLDNMMDEEDDLAHIENYTNEWQFYTAPGRHRERLLRRRSGHERPDPLVEYNVEERERALRARETGDWVEGRCPGGSSGAKRQQQQHAVEVRAAEKRPAEEQLSPPKKKKRGRPTNAEVAERKKVEKAAKKAAVAEKAARKAARRAAARAAKKAARRAAAASADAPMSSRLVTKEAMKQGGKRTAVILDDDECEESSSSSSSSPSPSSPSASTASGEDQCEDHVGSKEEGGEDQGSEEGGDKLVDGGGQE